MDEFGYIWLSAIQTDYKQLTETKGSMHIIN